MHFRQIFRGTQDTSKRTNFRKKREILSTINRIKVLGIRQGSRSTSMAAKSMFKCDQCDKEFKEEWMLSVHVKTHKKYKC